MNSVRSTAELTGLRPLSLERLTNLEGWLGRAALITLRYGLVGSCSTGVPSSSPRSRLARSNPWCGIARCSAGPTA